MNVYLSIGCEYKYDLAEWLIGRNDVEEVYMDYYPYSNIDNGRSLKSKHFHYVKMGDLRRDEAVDQINISDYPMPDMELLRKALKYESMAVHIGMRETNYPVHPYEESKRSYLFFFRLWNHELEKMNPGYIFFEETPHCMSVYTMYVVARVRGIPLTIINPTGIRIDNYSGGVYIYGNSIKNLGVNIGDMYENIKDMPLDQCVLTGKVKKYFERSLEGRNEAAESGIKKREWAELVYKQGFAPYNKHFYNTWYFLCYFAKKIGYKGRTHSLGRLSYENLRQLRENKKRVVSYVKHHTMPLKDYDKHAEMPDYNEKYVYFPLQQMPELTLFPLAGVTGEQYNTIQMLSRITEPYGVKVYVKEYYVQPFRDRKFWKDIGRLKNVRFIKSTVSSLDLIKGCLATANQTGTCLMEAVFEGKPALAFGGGHNWKGMPGLFEIKNEEQGRSIIRQIVEGIKIEIEDLQRYFFCIQKKSIEYYIKIDYSVERNAEYDNTMAYLKELIGNDLNHMNRQGGTNGP